MRVHVQASDLPKLKAYDIGIYVQNWVWVPVHVLIAHLYYVLYNIHRHFENYLEINGNKEKYEISISHSRKLEILLFLANMSVFFFKYHKIYKIQMSKLGTSVGHISHAHPCHIRWIQALRGNPRVHVEHRVWYEISHVFGFYVPSLLFG